MKFSKRSIKNLLECHIDLDLIAVTALAKNCFDFTVIEGYRDKVHQDLAFKSGFSNAKWPNSKHNSNPSMAFDFIPAPFNGWNDIESFKRVGKLLKDTADELYEQKAISHKVQYGGDWKSFKDYPHFELI